MCRAMLNPPRPEATAAAASEAAMANLPAWFKPEFRQKLTFQGFLGQVWIMYMCGL